MQKNGPLALAFNALVITFMLAPLLVVCIVAFTPHNTLTLPTTEFSLRWFKAVFAHSDFVQSFWNSLWLALASAPLATVRAALVGVDRSAEHAALSLGASQATVFTRITLPMILPGVTGGWLLAFINSF